MGGRARLGRYSMHEGNIREWVEEKQEEEEREWG